MINEIDKREIWSRKDYIFDIYDFFCLASLKTFENNLTLEALSQEETLWKFVTTFGIFWSGMIPIPPFLRWSVRPSEQMSLVLVLNSEPTFTLINQNDSQPSGG